MEHTKILGINNRVGTAKKERNSNLELFRILTMMAIVAHHYVVNSGLTSAGGPIYSDITSWRSIFLLLFGEWGKVGINCFVLITGYFMCTSSITAKKFFKLLFEVMFYKIVITAVFLISGYTEFSFPLLIKTLLPVTQIAQNFTGTYLVFFLCIPFLNILIKNLNEKQHICAIMLLAFTYIAFGTVRMVSMNYVSWYIVLYFIASYIRLYPKKCFANTKLWGALMLLCAFLCMPSVVCSIFIGEKLGKNSPYAFVSDANTLLAVCMGISSFNFFKNIKIKNSKFINGVAVSTFGVLLIHAGSDSMRAWLWGDLLKTTEAYYKTWMPLHAILSVLGIFVICCLIDRLRICTVEKYLFDFLDKHANSISIKVNLLLKKICKRLNIEC